MRRFDPRLWVGGLLIFLGLLTLLDNLNIISGISDIFWGVIWGGIGLFFLYKLLTERASWWAAFPAFTLLGLSASSFLTGSLEAYDGLVFFAGIAFAFWWVYFTDTQRWWAIIPGGVMLTLGVVSALDAISGADSGGLFLLGLGLTFVLVAVLPGGSSRSWALIPGVILLILGAVTGTSLQGFAGYIWPALLIILGGFFVVRFFGNRAPR